MQLDCSSAGGVEARMNAFGADNDHFAGADVALVIGADQIEGAGLGGEDDGLGAAVSGRDAAHAERAEAAGVAGGEDAVGGRHDEREGAFDAAQGVGDGVFECLLAGLRDEMDDDLGVPGGLEDGALGLNLPRISDALTRLPLWARAMRPLLHSTEMGWALRRAESPVVE